MYILVFASSLEIIIFDQRLVCVLNYLNETRNKYINTEYTCIHHLYSWFVYMLPCENTLLCIIN